MVRSITIAIFTMANDRLFVDTSFWIALELARTFTTLFNSLTDCISFIVMRERGLTTALAFDNDFRQAGFISEPL